MSELFDPTAPLTASGNLRRRQAVSRLVALGATASAFAAASVLVILTIGVIGHGASSLSISFLTKDPPRFGGPRGGIASAIVGTTIVVAVATAIALPISVLCALYLTEFAPPRSRFAAVLRTALDLLQGIPTIVVGLFVFGLLVKPLHKETGFAGSVALAIVMLPLIARASQGVLEQVPGSLREAAEALGVSHWRTVIGVILPAAVGGIATGTMLAVARAAGETAPLLLTTSLFTSATSVNLFGHAVPNIPVLIFTSSEAADPAGLSRAWGAALVLLVVILIANIAARLLASRFSSKLGQ
jgi:phosphate transport system permease protein